jgi:hypothetical protein
MSASWHKRVVMARRGVVRHPVITFMLISLGAYFVTAAIPPIVNSEVLPFGLPLYGVVGGVLGVGLAAFLVTATLSGPAGVADLGRRSVRWRVSVRWYLIALSHCSSLAPLFVWFYNRTGFSVLLVAIFHASFDAAISQLSYDVVPGSNTARFVIIATKGQLGRANEAVEIHGGVSFASP